MTVTASATAEAYNASSAQTSTGNYVPIAPKCVKPLLIANKDPTGGAGKIVDSTTGDIVVPNLVGHPAFPLTDSCPKSGPPSGICFNPNPNPGEYVPASVNNPNTVCPSCQGAADFEQSIECCDLRTYSCGGATTTDTTADIAITKGAVHNAVNAGV
jgi:hypothetical protein